MRILSSSVLIAPVMAILIPKTNTALLTGLWATVFFSEGIAVPRPETESSFGFGTSPQLFNPRSRRQRRLDSLGRWNGRLQRNQTATSTSGLSKPSETLPSDLPQGDCNKVCVSLFEPLKWSCIRYSFRWGKKRKRSTAKEAEQTKKETNQSYRNYRKKPG